MKYTHTRTHTEFIGERNKKKKTHSIQAQVYACNPWPPTYFFSKEMVIWKWVNIKFIFDFLLLTGCTYSLLEFPIIFSNQRLSRFGWWASKVWIINFSSCLYVVWVGEGFNDACCLLSHSIYVYICFIYEKENLFFLWCLFQKSYLYGRHLSTDFIKCWSYVLSSEYICLCLIHFLSQWNI